MLIDGRKIASKIIEDLKKKSPKDRFLAAVLVGRDENSLSFLKQKERVAKELGIDFFLYNFADGIQENDLVLEISKIAADEKCGGIIIQLPLPSGIDRQKICNAVPIEKDVDVLSEVSLGRLASGKDSVLPPAAATLEKIILENNFNLKNAKAAVIGRGFLVGRPIASWLVGRVAELDVYHSRTEDLSEKLRSADLVVSGVGKAHLFGAAEMKAGALVVDFGYSFRDGKIVGDFNPPAGDSNVAYTPTPGGTGPVLVAELFENFVKLNKKSGF